MRTNKEIARMYKQLDIVSLRKGVLDGWKITSSWGKAEDEGRLRM